MLSRRIPQCRPFLALWLAALACAQAGAVSADSHAIPLTGGIPISRGILGQNVYCQTGGQRALDMKIVQNSSMRGIAGGLWADSYNWKTLTGNYIGPQTTLDILREARDKNAELNIIANCRGFGTGTGSSFVFTDRTTATIASMAADWVRYTNKIVPNYRQGDPISGRDRDIVNSITWTNDKLLKTDERPTRRVKYWEIGNEPEVPLEMLPTLPAPDYHTNYLAMTNAMLAEDPEIKVGPCITTAGGETGNAWLNAILTDPACRVDFVAYHPYGPLYWFTKNLSGGVLDGATLESGLNYMKGQQPQRRQEIVNWLTAAGRDPNTPLWLTEYNPSSWEGTYYYNLSRTQAHALGVAETIFTFAEMGVKAAQYWDHPNQGSTTKEMPGFKVYEQLQDYMGDILLDSYVNGSFRLYTTKDSATGRVVIWALNMSNTNDWTIDISLTGWTGGSYVRRMTLGALSGDTALVMINGATEVIGWTTTDLTGQINPAAFSMTFDNATLTTLIVDPVAE